MATTRPQSAEIEPLMVDQAYALIRHDILTCKLTPGASISESLLAERYGFGKAPIRAALSRLKQEGLVHSSPRRSYIVTPITLRDVHELYELRLVLEPACCRLAAGKVDATHLAQLDAICKLGYTPGDPDSTLRFLDANQRFHLTVAQATGNRRLLRMLAQVLDEMTRVMHIGLGERNRNAEMQHEHASLLEALQAGDGKQAADLCEEQIVASRDMVISAILNSPELLNTPIG
ncbi:MAG TPA: GntR family transcriptional regulator [Paucimonas sp.]|nr:GntR family transcriptional regulator [Paucimonas sp.]